LASNDVVVVIHEIVPPSTAFAAYGVRTGGSTPAEQVPHWAFDAGTDEFLDFHCRLQGYGGAGLTFTMSYMAATAVTGGALIALGIRRRHSGANAISVAHTYVFTEVRLVVPAASGQPGYGNIVLTSGANMDNLANGEDFILRMRRLGSNNVATTGDDLVGDFQLIGLVGKET
jgi:hypothetical protein